MPYNTTSQPTNQPIRVQLIRIQKFSLLLPNWRCKFSLPYYLYLVGYILSTFADSPSILFRSYLYSRPLHTSRMQHYVKF